MTPELYPAADQRERCHCGDWDEDHEPQCEECGCGPHFGLCNGIGCADTLGPCGGGFRSVLACRNGKTVFKREERP